METTMTWGTWEELLLASAVKRHGSDDWSAVALELQARTVLPPTPLSCNHKYLDLRRRFAADGDTDAIPWLEDLRNLRLAELRRELQRYDASIMSLQSKVKRLEEERERSAEPNGDGRGSPDLEKESENFSGNDKNQPENLERDAAGNSVSGERKIRSVNGSNSSGAKTDEKGDEGDRTGSRKPDLSGSMAVAVEDSCDGSSEPRRVRKGADSGELRDSLAESSDVQSSASLTGMRKSQWRNETSGGEDPPEIDGDEARTAKSGALVGLLEAIRRQKQSSLFERRQESQENEKYKRIVRQHVDLETIEKRVQRGSYGSCSLGLYRDLVLLFNNAIVFFPKTSPESISARKLRHLVSNEMHKQAHRSDLPHDSAPSPPKPPLERSDSLLAKHKSSAPIIVCRKRSSISAKPSSITSSEKKPAGDSKPPAEDQISAAKEKPVTGTRTVRRSAKQISAPAETPRLEKKKAESLASEKKKSAADFLKRIKQNSQAESPKSSRGAQKKNKGKVSKEERSPAKRSVGRPPKKVVEAAPAKRGRGEAVTKEASSASKRPKKRAKR